jgi:hypothetical protein
MCAGWSSSESNTSGGSNEMRAAGSATFCYRSLIPTERRELVGSQGNGRIYV